MGIHLTWRPSLHSLQTEQQAGNTENCSVASKRELLTPIKIPSLQQPLLQELNIKHPTAHKERRRRRQTVVCPNNVKTSAGLPAVLCLQPHHGELSPFLSWPVKYMYDQPCCWSLEYEYLLLLCCSLVPADVALFCCVHWDYRVSPRFFSWFLGLTSSYPWWLHSVPHFCFSSFSQ